MGWSGFHSPFRHLYFDLDKKLLYLHHWIFFWRSDLTSLMFPRIPGLLGETIAPGIDTWGWWIHNEEEGDDVTSSGNFNMFIKTFIERKFVERKYTAIASLLSQLNCEMPKYKQMNWGHNFQICNTFLLTIMILQMQKCSQSFHLGFSVGWTK